ncbi:hypothetical protein NDU88_001549 [Pleurodeles waltl]|uniref:DJ-1/PfpI domain-containing protein n=1 Tax=Pleurodeles waltl TaxID=8319 RepID=A0AAV7MNR1_PLEWA|nr:hypothetical protein NDU88_001549 [Pleurodeles waltl]
MGPYHTCAQKLLQDSSLSLPSQQLNDEVGGDWSIVVPAVATLVYIDLPSPVCRFDVLIMPGATSANGPV